MDNSILQIYNHLVKMFWRILFITLGILAIVYVFPYIKHILLIFIFSWLLAILLIPVINEMESRGINRSMGIAAVLIIIIGILFFLFSLVVPSLSSAIDSLSHKFNPERISELNTQVSQYFVGKFNNPDIAETISENLNKFGLRALAGFAVFIKNTSGFLALLPIMPLISFFLMKDMLQFKRKIIAMVPNRYFEITLSVLHKVNNQVSSYIQGKSLETLIIGVLSIIALFIINIVFSNSIPQYLFVGVLAGLLNMIPYIGPLIGMIIAILIAVLNSPENIMLIITWIAIAFTFIQFLDNVLVAPLVVSKSIDMHPLLVVLIVIIGGNIAGVMGMLFAIPVVGIIKVIIEEVNWGYTHYHHQKIFDRL